MMKNQWLWLLVPVVLGLFGQTYLAADKASDPITIGILENEEFDFAAMMKGSFNLALDTINARGGINGRPLKLVFAIDSGKKKKGVQAVRHLIREQGAVMLVGGYSSSNTLAMTREAERLDTPFLVCTAADDRITQRKRKNIFRLNPPTSGYTGGLEGLLLERVKPASIAILYENSPYGTGGAMRMMWFCRENDIEITAIVPYHRERAGPDYFGRLMAPLRKKTPDLIYMVSYLKDAVEWVKLIRGAGIDALLSGNAGGFTHPDFIQMAGPSANHLLTVTLWTPGQDDVLARHYVSRYREAYQQTPDYHGAEAYSAIMVAADALRRSADLSSGALRRSLSDTRLDTPFGQVTFQSYGNYDRQNSRTTLVLQVIGDRYQCVWPKEVAIAQVVLPAR